LGLRDPVVAAGVQYEVPLADLRSGTIDLWIRTGYDWLKRYETPDQTEEYSVLVIPLVGGVHNVISLYLERPGTGGQGDTGMVEMKSTLIFHLSISLNLFRLPWSRGRCLGEGSSERLGSGTRTFGERRGNHPYREWHHTGRT
jgi:hypothetical protein